MTSRRAWALGLIIFIWDCASVSWWLHHLNTDVGTISTVVITWCLALNLFLQYDLRSPAALSTRLAAAALAALPASLLATGMESGSGAAWGGTVLLMVVAGGGGRRLLEILSGKIGVHEVRLTGSQEACDALRKAAEWAPAWPIHFSTEGGEEWQVPEEFGVAQRMMTAGTRSWQLHARPWPTESAGGRIKRAVDLAVALPLFLALLPGLAAVALVLYLFQGRPVLYGQTRVTDGHRPFRIWKFRSMGPTAEPDGRPVWPSLHDRRTTPLGGFLRRTWVDELPQLWNVIRGDLSLIGPRPERPEFVQVFTKSMPIYPLRHCARGGLTGLAQAYGYVGNTSIRQRLHLDLVYVNNWSPCLDLLVVGVTLRQFVFRKRRKQFDYIPGRDAEIP